MSTTELCLMSFNDEFKKVIFNKYAQAVVANPNVDPTSTITFATQISNVQAEYVKFKTAVEFILSLTQL